MAYLFEVSGKTVIPTTEALLIEPYKIIWDRDTSPGKEQAIEDFTFIEFITSQLKSNPYKGYSKEKKEQVIVTECCKSRDNYKPMTDPLIVAGIKRIEKFQEEASPTYSLYKDALEGKNKVQQFLKTVDLTKRTNQGAAVYKPKDVTNALLDIDRVSASLTKLKEKVEQELFDEIKTRAAKSISPFAMKH
jgi:hypothetical protein